MISTALHRDDYSIYTNKVIPYFPNPMVSASPCFFMYLTVDHKNNMFTPLSKEIHPAIYI